MSVILAMEVVVNYASINPDRSNANVMPDILLLRMGRLVQVNIQVQKSFPYIFLFER